MEGIKNNDIYTMDIETFKNLFTIVLLPRDPDWPKDKVRTARNSKFIEFAIHDVEGGRNDYIEFMEFLRTNPNMVGYNSLDFDAQVIEEMFNGKARTATQIYKFAQRVIESDRFRKPYKHGKFSHNHLDLFKINHYDNPAKSCSLKWLEMSMRWGKMADLPFDHTKNVTVRQVEDVLKYNRNDVLVTEKFYDICRDSIDLRKELAREYKDISFLNKSDSSIGSDIFYSILKENGVLKAKRGAGTRYKKLNVDECIFDYVNFKTDTFNEILDDFKSKTLYSDDTGNLQLKNTFNISTEYDGMEYVYGVGGIHGAIPGSVWQSDEDNVILSMDVKSYYPNLAIKNRYFPKHLSEKFCDIYEQLYDKRSEYKKGTSMNYAIKILLNSVYGKSNSHYSYLYDPKYTVITTVNGQLLLTMLAERLTLSGNAKVVMINTDGLECIVPRSKVEEIKKITAAWEELTKLTLEYDTYKQLVVRDVNNYIATTEDGQHKRKGVFEIYTDYMPSKGSHFLHKNTSKCIISSALNAFYTQGVLPRDYIMAEDNIHEFLCGVKRKRNFDYIILKSQDNGIIDLDKHNDRVLRYYISKDGGNLFKLFNDGRKNSITGVNRGQLIKPLKNVRNTDASIYKDLDRQFYIDECNSIINNIKNNNLKH